MLMMLMMMMMKANTNVDSDFDFLDYGQDAALEVNQNFWKLASKIKILAKQQLLSKELMAEAKALLVQLKATVVACFSNDSKESLLPPITAEPESKAGKDAAEETARVSVQAGAAVDAPAERAGSGSTPVHIEPGAEAVYSQV